MGTKFRIKDLPLHERPRERMLKKGTEVLSDSELLTIVIGKGNSNLPANIISQELLSKYKSLQNLARTAPAELLRNKGIGEAKACLLSACFELAIRISTTENLDKKTSYTSSKTIYNLLKPKLSFKDKEILLVVSLDSRYKLIAVDQVSVGTVNESLVHPREVFRTALQRQASSIVLAHNHPSGDPEPSQQDISITKRLMEVSYVVGIPINDHIIIGNSNYLSLKESVII